MAELTDVRTVIEKLGGTEAVKRLTGRRTDQAISNWRQENRFPTNTFLVLTEELARLGHTASPTIWGMAEAAHDAA